jgi:hypothetical protein
MAAGRLALSDSLLVSVGLLIVYDLVTDLLVFITLFPSVRTFRNLLYSVPYPTRYYNNKWAHDPASSSTVSITHSGTSDSYEYNDISGHMHCLRLIWNR